MGREEDRDAVQDATAEDEAELQARYGKSSAELSAEAERGYDIDSFRDDEINPRLIRALEELGHEYGPLGVALVAVRLTDPHVVASILSQMAKDIRAAKRPQGERDELVSVIAEALMRTNHYTRSGADLEAAGIAEHIRQRARSPKEESPPPPSHAWAYTDGTGDVELFATREVAEALIAERYITSDWVEDNIAEFTSTSDLVEGWLAFWSDEGMELRRVEVEG